MGFFRKRPTTLEVMNAIFDEVFSPEDLASMHGPEHYVRVKEDKGFKADMFKLASCLRPRYSIKKSVQLTKEFVEPCRRDLSWNRYKISLFIIDEIFEDVAS